MWKYTKSCIYNDLFDNIHCECKYTAENTWFEIAFPLSHLNSARRSPAKRLIFQQIKLNHLLFFRSVGFCVCCALLWVLDRLMISKYWQLMFKRTMFSFFQDWDVCLPNGVNINIVLCALCGYCSFRHNENWWVLVIANGKHMKLSTYSVHTYQLVYQSHFELRLSWISTHSTHMYI